MIIGLLAVGGWCVFMGPCKEWFSQLTSGIGGGSAAARYGLDDATYNKIKQAVTGPEARQLMNEYQAGKVSPNELRERASAIGLKYANHSLVHHRDTISI